MAKIVRWYDPAWKGLFELEAVLLRRIWGDAAFALHHIGSTAIPGMISKPVVDVLVEVRSPQAVDERNSEMVAAGYEPRGEYGIEGRRYFVKPADTKGIGFHVHAYERGSSHIDRHLRFRDFLLSHPEVAQEYSALKLSLSDRNGVLVKDYAERKAPFVRRVEGLALDSR